MDQDTLFITQLKMEVLRVASGELTKAQELYNWVAGDTIDKLVDKRLEKIGVELAKD